MSGTRLYVGNLSYSVTNEQLGELFAPHGTPKEISVIEGKGFAFVEMATPEEADKAREALNGADYKGRALRIDEARPRKDREGGGGGGRPPRGNRD